MKKLIMIFYNPKKGYVFCASTTTLPKKMRTYAKPAILLPSKNASEENVGKYIREAIDLAKNAKPIDLEKEELYKYWQDAGYKTNGSFTKEHICMEFEEIEDNYYYSRWVYYKQGCYVGTCHWYERDSIKSNISNNELGHLIIEQMNSFIECDFKSKTKYIWDGSTWINNKTKK